MADLGTASQNASCSHDCSLPEALDIGRAMGMALPGDDDICLVGIVAADVSSFGESLSPGVAGALPGACDAVCRFLSEKTCAEAT